MAFLEEGWSGAALGFGLAVGVLLMKTVGNTVAQLVTGTTITDWAEGVV